MKLKSNQLKLVLAQAVGLLIMSNAAQGSGCSGYSSLVYNSRDYVYIGNQGCDTQNAIIGSPNSASSLMFQQDFDMSGLSMSLDEAEETSDSASLDEGQSYQQNAALEKSTSDALGGSRLADTVYRPGRDSGRFLTMGYPGNTANGYRFLATNGIPSESSLRAADASSLSGLYTSGLSASYSGIGTSDAVTLPLDAKIKLGNGYVLSLNLPLSYIENNNTTNSTNTHISTSYYSASLGAGLTIPLSHLFNMKDVWALTVLSRVGGIDSDSNKDPASAIIYSAGILSQYDMRLAGGVFGIKNMFSYYGTSAQRDNVFKSFDTLGNPVYGSQTDDIDVGVFRNGVYYSHYLGPVVFGRKLSGTIFFTDTRFEVAEQYSALYMDSMQQVGFNLGLAPKHSRTGSFVRRMLDAQDMRIGMTYTTADLPQNKTLNVDGFGVNFGFTF